MTKTKKPVKKVPKCSNCGTMIILEEGELQKSCTCGRVEYTIDGRGKTWINTTMSASFTMVKPKKEKPRDGYIED